MQQSYGIAQIKQIELTKSDVLSILTENLKERVGETYNFDISNPVIFANDKGGFTFRYLTVDMKEDGKPRALHLKPLVSIQGGTVCGRRAKPGEI